MIKQETLLSVQDLRVHFHGNGPVARAVDGISYDIFRGETVCVVGESGCGKSVSALAVMGLLDRPPAEIVGGRILFENTNLLFLEDPEMQKIRGKKISMVFQEPLTSLNPVFTIGDQISEAIIAHEQVGKQELEQRTIQLLRDIGLPSPEERMHAYPHQLSGGQRQRIMIAMALACHPELIIADEPTTALDVTIQAQILNLLKSFQKTGAISFLYITHDLGVVASIADRVYVMYAGIIVEQGNATHIFDEPKHPYTRGLLDSLPHRGKKGKHLSGIPGSVPHAAYKPSGCPFHPRCALAMAACGKIFPGMGDYGDGHLSRCPVVYVKGQ